MTRLGRYTVEEELGRGSMGVVYLAHDPQIRRRVAVKTISLPDGLSDAQRSEYRARFLREAQAAGSLTHPGIVTIYGVEEVTGRDLPFITMEYVAGRNLQHILATEGRLVPERAFQMAMSLAEALQTAHAAGIIHRDIKPANVLVRDKDGAVKITDFGVARVPMGDLTTGNGILGSPSYMAPEQIKSGTADERSDLFALGVILHEAITGERLHGGDDLVTIAEKVANRPVPSVSARIRGLPSSTDAFFLKALAKDPAERFPNAAAFREAINEVLLEMELDRLSTSAPDMPFIVTDAGAVGARERRASWGDPRILAAAAAGVILLLLVVVGGATLLGSKPEVGASPPPSPSLPAAEPVDTPHASRPVTEVEVSRPAPAAAGATTTTAASSEPPPGAARQGAGKVPRSAAAADSEPTPSARPARPPSVPAPSSSKSAAAAQPPVSTQPSKQPAPPEPPAPSEQPAAAPPEEARAAPDASADVVPPPLPAPSPDALATSPIGPLPDTLQATPPLYTGSVLLAVKSKVKDGTLSVLVDGEEIYSLDLEASGTKFNRLLKKVTQAAHENVQEAIEVPAGTHTVTARLQIAGKAAVSEASVELDLAAGTTRTIEISAGRKFGLGDALHVRLSD